MGRLQDLELALILKLSDRVTYPAGRIQKAAQAMSGRLKETRTALQEVHAQSRSIDAFQKLDAKLSETSTKLSAAQSRLKDLQREYNATDAPSKRLQKELESAGKRADQLTKRQEELRRKTGELRKELKGAGFDTSRLGDAEDQLKKRSEQLNATLAQQERQLKKLNQLPNALAARWDAFKGKMRSFALWGSLAAGTATAVGGGLVLPMINTASQFEGYQSVLKVIEGSSEKAKASMAWVQDFAQKTPYELADVTEAFVRLRSYGLNPTDGLLRTLGDTSSAMNKPIMSAVEAIADAVTGENERLKEFGIRASAQGNLIRYQFTDKAGKQRELGALKDDRVAIQSVLVKIWNEKFSGAMEEQSHTWKGITSNLSDMWSKFQVMVMNSGPFEKLKAKAEQLLERLNTMAANGQLQEWANHVGAVISKVIDALTDIAPKIWSVIESFASFSSGLASFMGGWDNLAIAIAGGQIVSGLAQVIMGFKNVSAMLEWVGAAAVANPITATIIAISMLALLLITHWDKAKSWFGDFLSGIRSGFAPLTSAFDRFGTTTSKFLDALAPAGQILGQLLETVLDLLAPTSALANGLDGNASNAARFGALLSELLTGPLAAMVDALAMTIGLLTRLGTWLGETAGAVVVGFGNLIDGATALVSSLPQRFMDAGRNIIDGLLAGIDERWQALKARILELGDLLPEWLKEKLQIHSPSRVFTRLGGYISDGVGAGIDQRAGSALAAVQRLGDRLPSALPTVMAVGLAATGAAHASPTGGFGAESAGAGSLFGPININVYASPNQSPQDIGQEVARQLANLQREADFRRRARLYDGN